MNTLNKLVLLSVLTMAAACEQQQQPSQMGEGMDQAGQEMGQAGEGAADQVGQAGQGDQQQQQQAQREMSFASWDANGDGRIEASELNQRMSTLHSEWAGDDDRLTREELASGLHRAFDRNGDGNLEVNELDQRLASAIGGQQMAQPQSWDTDSDGRISEQELAQVLEQGGAWQRWDRDGDGSLTPDELGQGWLQTWDQNGDGAIEQSEWPWGNGGV